ncbi:MAG: hypothetical protein FWG10_13530 [Eubacteriaceae bacterium]|nr:hypothetical protein [Eubacteriaceae bacterium]
MKKTFWLLLCLVLVLAASCGSNSRAVNDEKSGNDVDLTQFSATIAYAEISNIGMKPDEYVGRTIKVNGKYYTTYEVSDNLRESRNHYIIIEDVSACCIQGFQFKWRGDHSFPEDYPQELAEIGVDGVFRKETGNNGEVYYYLDVDEITRI